MKSQKVKKLLKQISEILSDVDINDHRGQPTSNEELNIFVDKLKNLKITDPENEFGYTLFGTDAARALVNLEYAAKHGDE
tara:strand:- start:139 stop:378 length:240 start_codon:yes stop_codon:yes gene_type:complete